MAEDFAKSLQALKATSRRHRPQTTWSSSSTTRTIVLLGLRMQAVEKMVRLWSIRSLLSGFRPWTAR